jgi:small subunit ribosomal protein S5
MEEENVNKEIVEITPDTTAPVAASDPLAMATSAHSRNAGPDMRDPRNMKRNPRRPSNRREPRERVKPEFDQKIIGIRRVVRVSTGGRRFAFSVAVIAGDHNGRVGIGQGKASDTPLAIDKAFRDAKKNMIKVALTKNHSIPHEVRAKFSGARVVIMKAPGKGVLAGSSVRTVLEFAGIKEVGAKILSPSKNKVNNAKAAIKALQTLKAPRQHIDKVAAK